jgi:hypothetical protein
MLSGSPSRVFRVSDYIGKTQELWNLLKSTFNKDFLHMASIGTNPTLNLNLPTGHAYSIMGINEVIDPQSKETY